MKAKLEELRKKRLELCAKVAPINTEIYLIECEMYALKEDIEQMRN